MEGFMSYSIRYSSVGDADWYTVGTWDPPRDGLPQAEWRDLRDCATKEEAFAFINYLNGGDGKAFDAGWDT
jgi:hypothetical protein